MNRYQALNLYFTDRLGTNALTSMLLSVGHAIRLGMSSSSTEKWIFQSGSLCSCSFCANLMSRKLAQHLSSWQSRHSAATQPKEHLWCCAQNPNALMRAHSCMNTNSMGDAAKHPIDSSTVSAKSNKSTRVKYLVPQRDNCAIQLLVFTGGCKCANLTY